MILQRNDESPSSYARIVDSPTPTGLRDAAIALDRRERSRLRDPEAALALWHGLVTGRWSVVSEFDTDGRHYLLVRQNPTGAAEAERALTRRERQVAGFAGLGHSSKLIAYEMGLSESTVAAHLKCAARKLGCRSRVDLVRVVATVAVASQ